MGTPLRVLVVEDSQDDAQLLVRQLSQSGFDSIHRRVETPGAMRDALGQEPWDFVISDYRMQSFTALEAMTVLRETGLDLPFVILSRSIGEKDAIEAMLAGAHDYVFKDQPARLIPVIHRELREAAQRRQRKDAEEAMLHLAYHDALTGLPNRALLRSRLQQELESQGRKRNPLALLLIDLDRFKEVNDTLGHRHGDELLREVAHRIREILPARDLIARLGGDEFAVLLPSAGEAEAVETAWRILAVFEKPFSVGALSLEIYSSIGIAVHPIHGSDADQLLQRADVAMYLAKGTAKGYAVYDPQRDEHDPQRLTFLTQLHRAIDLDQLFLLYQAKMDLRTRLLVGVEALVRWGHPQDGVILPQQFVPLAERAGLIRPLTLWVLRRSLAQCREWHRSGKSIAVSVNLSSRDLEDLAFPDRVEDLLRSAQVSVEQLELEITESGLMTDPGHSTDVLTRLARMGIRISIDDFGTGYSSLARLMRLPVSIIKIDKSFVLGMGSDANAERIVRSIIDLGHSLSKQVVAEGVESEGVLRKLESFQCDIAQGHYLGLPLPPQEILRWRGPSGG